MIGMSISFCIAAMSKGLVNPDDVTKIIGGSAYSTLQEVEAFVRFQRYSANIWDDKAVELFWEFWRSGKIEQPRLTNPDYWYDLSNGLWISD